MITQLFVPCIFKVQYQVSQQVPDKTPVKKTKMYPNGPECMKLYQNVPNCTEMFQMYPNIPKCT